MDDVYLQLEIRAVNIFFSNCPNGYMEKYFYAEFNDSKISVSGDLHAKLGTQINGEGLYAEWDWDGNTFSLENDRYGFYPIYFAHEGNKFAVSASITKLLELGFSRDLNYEGIAVFLRFASFVGEDTAFKVINSVPPGSVLKWEKGNIDLKSDDVIFKDEINISRKDAVATYAELFQKGVEKTLLKNESTIVPLSGGRDSRHILFSLSKTNSFPNDCLTAYHQPPRANEDARIASLVSERLGLEHHLIPQKNSRILTEKHKNIITGFGAYEHGWFMTLVDYIKGRWNVIYDGIGGDMLTEDNLFTKEEYYLYKDEKLEELADRFLENEAYLPKILNTEVYQKMSRKVAIKRMVEEMEKHLIAPNPFSSFYLWNRTRRCIALSFFRLFGDDFKILTPYLDSELFDFLSSIKGEMFFGNTFHEETISYAFPEYADIPFENLNASPNLDSISFRRYSREILQYAASNRNLSLTNRSFFLTRCLRGMVDKNYSRNITDFGDMSIVLLQLERLNREIPIHSASLPQDQYQKPAKLDTKPQKGYQESQLQSLS